jgi:branched-chain amino acid transport system permease protein
VRRALPGAAAILLGAVLLVLPGVLSPFTTRVFQLFFFAASLATAWNLLGGFAGYWSFGHSGFVGLGAFAAALSQEHSGVGDPNLGFGLGILLAAAAAGALAALIAYPVLRLRGTYFAVAMLGVSLILSELASNLDIFEGGVGITLDPVGPAWMLPEVFYYYAFLAMFVIALAVAVAIRASKLHYGLTAICEDEDTAPMLGVPTMRYKTIVFVLSAALTGAIGAIYADSLGYITTESAFRSDLGLDIIVYCLLGGIGTVAGPVLGAALMTWITQTVLGGLLQIHLLLTGLLVVAIILLMPKGILGLFASRARPAKATPGQTALARLQAAEPAGPGPILELRDVSVRFRGLQALRDINLVVPSGTICSVIGPNGAGKSTLFNVVTGFLRPSSGAVLYRGARIDGLSTSQLSRRGIARAFQIARPFHGLSVFDNVMVGALFGKAGPRAPRAVTEAALHITGLEALRDAPASSLPVGHLRRLELARVIATRPDLVLADEPCAGLNATETHDIVAILDALRRHGVTVVLVEHDMATVMRVSEKVFVIAAGANICDGSPDEVVQDARVIEAYLGTPVAQATADMQAI